MGIISSKFSLEGPVGNGSWFISGRRTYFDLISKAIDKRSEESDTCFWFYDINAKITQNFGANDKVFISGFASKDKFEFNTSGVNGELGIQNQMLSTRWTHIFGDDLFATLNFTASAYDNNFNVDMSGYQFLINNGINDYSLRGSFECTLQRI